MNTREFTRSPAHTIATLVWLVSIGNLLVIGAVCAIIISQTGPFMGDGPVAYIISGAAGVVLLGTVAVRVAVRRTLLGRHDPQGRVVGYLMDCLLPLVMLETAAVMSLVAVLLAGLLPHGLPAAIALGAMAALKPNKALLDAPAERT